MKRRVIFVALVATAFVAWLVWQRQRVPAQISTSPPQSARTADPDYPQPRRTIDPETKNPVERSTLADALNSPGQTISADLQLISALLDTFRSNFPREGNPVGENAEITAVLTGTNALHLALVPRDHPAINAKGELCDRWGTPFFFHQISGTEMEIRSAGPDHTLHTPDDIVLKP